jgi:hypothetical protein
MMSPGQVKRAARRPKISLLMLKDAVAVGEGVLPTLRTRSPVLIASAATLMATNICAISRAAQAYTIGPRTSLYDGSPSHSALALPIVFPRAGIVAPSSPIAGISSREEPGNIIPVAPGCAELGRGSQKRGHRPNVSF